MLIHKQTIITKTINFSGVILINRANNATDENNYKVQINEAEKQSLYELDLS